MREARALGGVAAGVLLALVVVALSHSGAISGTSLAATSSSTGSTVSTNSPTTTLPTRGVATGNSSSGAYAAVVALGTEANSPSDLASLPKQSAGLNILVVVPFALAALLATALYRATARRRDARTEPV